MATTLARIIKYGFQNFWRNGWLSTATVIIMALALVLFQGLLLFDVVTSSAVASIQEKIDVAVYFVQDAPEADILAIRDSLEAFPEIAEVRYVSRDEALAIFREKHEGEEFITQALDEVGENPLFGSLNVRTTDPKDYVVVEEFLAADQYQPLIAKISSQSQDNRDAIERLDRIISTLNKVGFVFTIFIALVAALVAFNTIRLAIYSNREEIGIMKLVGASNIFAKGPYIVSGILYGFIGAVLALILAAPAINLASPVFTRLIPELNVEAYFYDNLSTLFLYLLVAGVALGIGSSWIAIRRYLKI
ncbi:MAG: hypothetical protein COU11_01175 [Candidatus Harrisonbacteria bacterium CG10_big_fil_rev_8_21_14_0_10_49_15]|uniref:Cell division protein FtsX n=1 Tax=Candidatus Harrisonbacteria bacterium CG10_big_fil_rev_8_21_14_0_10_49_15 TaxID=1974587 RepID=A0A2H0ULQ3_9BACT|nr:MAG: hypothetical protein COU11_01175 [Candidatus Harrisonbacteria bacterium CG10_big_fil_rev_8_21_14_0_10_49_15]